MADEDQESTAEGESEHPSSTVSLEELAQHGAFSKRGDVRTVPFRDKVAAKLAWALFGLITLLALLIIAQSWMTRPDIDPAQFLTNDQYAKTALATYEQLLGIHSKYMSELSRTMLTAGIIPLFTLILGYLFGTRGER